MAGRDVRELLEPGEDVEDSVEVGDNRVVVTNRRVLAFTPDGPGKRYHTVDRPNVTDVAVRIRSRRTHLLTGGVALVLAAGLVAAGRLIETDGLFSGVSTGPGAGALGVGGFVSRVSYWLGLVDDGLLYAGLAVLVAVLFYAARYVHSRRAVIAIGVAGAEDVDLPVGELTDPHEHADDLRFALELAVESEEGDPVETEPVWE